jgi:hypothetical protein
MIDARREPLATADSAAVCALREACRALPFLFDEERGAAVTAATS